MDVTYVAMVIHLCCKYLAPMFHTYVTSVSFECCVCFAMPTHVFFPSVSDICCKYFNCFGRMLQMFHLNVIKIDLVLHILQWDPSTAATYCSCWARLHVCLCAGGTTMWARNTEQRGPLCSRGRRCGVGPHMKQAQQARTSEH
jgi:hypothetical protein